jgi:hypothetical protein
MTQAEKKKSTKQTSTSHSTGQGKQARYGLSAPTGMRAGATSLGEWEDRPKILLDKLAELKSPI